MFQFHQEVVSESFDEIVCAPAGIFPHSRSPDEIALSVVAQIQEKLGDRIRIKLGLLFWQRERLSVLEGSQSFSVLAGSDFY